MISILKDVRASVAFLTRIPVPVPARFESDSQPVSSSVWAFPVAGLVVGGLAAAVFAAFRWLGVPVEVSAIAAIAAAMVATGALHEDGLADFADGVWGGSTAARRLLIMEDSRIGAFGALALFASFAGRAAAVWSIGDTASVAFALVAAAVSSRAAMPFLMVALPPAKQDGLGAGAGRPTGGGLATGAAIALFAAFVVAPRGALECVVGAAAGALVIGLVARRALGGYTGDVLGAAQQMAELFALGLLAAAYASG